MFWISRKRNFNAVRDYLEKYKWPHTVDKENGVITGSCDPEKGLESGATFEVRLEPGTMHSLFTLNYYIPDESVARVVKFIRKVNEKTLVGDFVFDEECSKLCYRVKLMHEDFCRGRKRHAQWLMMFPIIMFELVEMYLPKLVGGELSVDEICDGFVRREAYVAGI